MGISSLVLSVLPILMVFYIHFRSYTSIGRLFAASKNSKLKTTDTNTISTQQNEDSE